MAKRAPSRMRTVRCVICAAPFKANHSQAKYCSPEHRQEGERASWRKYAQTNSVERGAYHRSLYRRNPERVIERTKAYQATEAGKRASAIAHRRQAEKFPEKIAARQAVLVAMRGGRLTRQNCEHCGDPKSQAHHPDYSKPLDIVWLCRPCHGIEHGRSARPADHQEVPA